MRWSTVFIIALGIGGGLLAGCSSSPSASRMPSHRPAIAPVPGTVSVTNKPPVIANAITPDEDKSIHKYDAAMRNVILRKWAAVLKGMKGENLPTGRVVVQFYLHADGGVSDVNILENQIGEKLGDACVRGIKDCAPFARWPADMVRLFGHAGRKITYTFNLK